MHGLHTKKFDLEAQDTTEYISVLLNPGHRHCMFTSKKENRVCLMQIPSATETAVELNRAYTTSTPIFKIASVTWENILRWYLGF